LSDIQPGQRPDPSSDEAGLWMSMERVEEKLSTSGKIVTNPELNAYMRAVTCKVSPEYCNDIRIYVVDTPHFNASMAPNGFMEIWTGSLLRCQNEAQLAVIISHEIAHYLRRHIVQQWRNVKNTGNALVFFQLATAAAGVGYAGDIARLVAIGAIFKFSRDEEREADDIGFDMMLQGGYDPREAPKIWEAIIAERDAADDPEQFIFFSTHPTPKERVETLKKSADTVIAQGKTYQIRQQEYLAAIGPYRASWLRDELQKQDFKAMQVVLDRLIETGYNLAELYFFQGEMFRLRGEEGDAEKAITSYQKALTQNNPPVEIYRSLGLVYWRLDQKQDARQYLEQYLKMNPGAFDAEMIKSYLNELEKKNI
jgi:predicted Zn-dependent protease